MFNSLAGEMVFLRRAPPSVMAVFIECADFMEIREQYYAVQDFKELFEKVNFEYIFGYLKEIGLFRKI